MEISDYLGVVMRGKYTKIVCPLPMHKHVNYTPSFSIYYAADGRQRFTCFGNCGARGDLIDLIGYLEVPSYDPKNKEDRKLAYKLAIRHGYESAPKIEIKKVVPERKIERLNLLRAFNQTFPMSERVREYCHKRGITDESIRLFQLGSYKFKGKEMLSIPIIEGGSLVGIKFRNISDKGLRYISYRGSKLGLFNADGVQQSKIIYVVKGEICAILLCQAGFPSCAPSQGEASRITDEMKSFLVHADKIIVIGDNPRVEEDKETIRRAEERAKALDADLYFPPKGYIGIDDYLLDKPQEAVEYLRRIGDV